MFSNRSAATSLLHKNSMKMAPDIPKHGTLDPMTAMQNPWNGWSDNCAAKWGNNASYAIDQGKHPHEAHYLKLDCSKAKTELGWQPQWDLEKALDSIIEWTKVYAAQKDVAAVCRKTDRGVCEPLAVSREPLLLTAH